MLQYLQRFAMLVTFVIQAFQLVFLFLLSYLCLHIDYILHIS